MRRPFTEHSPNHVRRISRCRADLSSVGLVPTRYHERITVEGYRGVVTEIAARHGLVVQLASATATIPAPTKLLVW